MSRCAFLLLLAFVAPSAAAQADTILITSGTVLVPTETFKNTFDLTGTRGFRLLASFDNLGSGLGVTCRPCEPGELLDIGGTFSSADFSGTVAVGRASYTLPSFDVDVTVGFLTDPLMLPALSSRAVLTAPFDLRGSLLLYDTATQQQALYQLIGRGTATITLTQNPFTPAWEFAESRYEFAPVPEPATGTLLLLGGGAITWTRGRLRARGPASDASDPGPTS
jgi:hypothetical protein